MGLTSKQKYNQSDKGKLKNAEYQRNRRKNPEYRKHYAFVGWHKRGLKYYPDNLFEEYEKKQNCSFCHKELKRNFMEHNHTTGTFRGFTCSSCNTSLGNTDKSFRNCMNEIMFLNKMPLVIKRTFLSNH